MSLNSNSLVLPVLVANIVVFVFLNRERVSTYVAGVRGRRMLNVYRTAGLLLMLVAVGHSQNIPCVRNGRVDKACQKRRAAEFQTPFVAGVVRDQDYETARAYAKANGLQVDWNDWNKQVIQSAGYNDAENDYLFKPEPEHKLSPDIAWLEKNWIWVGLGCLGIFLFLQFAGGHEADETNIHDQLDPEYRTGFVSDYHGDDAFIVPDGMHSEYESVPVRRSSAAAGR